MSFRDAVWYNAGRGASDGNNYWKKYGVPHWIIACAALVLWGALLGAASVYNAALGNAAERWGVTAGILASPEKLALNAAPCILLALLCFFALGRTWPAFLVSGAAAMGLSVADRCVYLAGGVHLRAGTEISAVWSALTRCLPSAWGRAVFAAAAAAAGTAFAALLLRGKMRSWAARVFGSLGTAAAMFLLWRFVYSAMPAEVAGYAGCVLDFLAGAG